jgi:hypothetical protein
VSDESAMQQPSKAFTLRSERLQVQILPGILGAEILDQGLFGSRVLNDSPSV